MPPLRGLTRERAPLIHCLMGPVSLNDCANLLLAVGARPIMAEHPREVRDITAGADALLLNLGTISDSRMKSMAISATEARAKGIPIVLDLVGVGCSRLRLDFAIGLVERFAPDVIKGNLPELTALWERRRTARGVDAEPGGAPADLRTLTGLTRHMADGWRSVVLMSGAADIVSSRDRSAVNHTGHPMLGNLTGTGCMLGALTAAFVSAGDPFSGAALAVLLEGVAGERAAAITRGIGSFRADFFDAIWNLTDEELEAEARWEEIE